MSELKAYEVEFRPIVNGIARPTRKVRIVAYSQKQANKFFFDWRHNTTKIPCIFEMSYELEKPKDLTFKEWKEEIQDHFEKQQKIIYRREDKDDNSNTNGAS